MTSLISQSHGDLTLVLAPELGGAIAALRWRGNDIFRPLPEEGEQRANLSGCFPLVPYSNRIAQGRFLFQGQQVTLKKNFGDHPHPLHGNGWLNAWELTAQTSDRLTLSLDHSAEGASFEDWPWPFRATQVFALTNSALQITLSISNLAEQSVPVGLGFHPYFANAADCEVQFIAQKVWLNNNDSLPASEVATPECWNYEAFRRPLPATVDNCFTQWNGSAVVRWPQRKIQARVSSPDACNAVFFTPVAGKNFVAIEPVTHINNAIHLFPVDGKDQAMNLLAPGESLSVTMHIEVSDYE